MVVRNLIIKIIITGVMIIITVISSASIIHPNVQITKIIITRIITNRNRNRNNQFARLWHRVRRH